MPQATIAPAPPKPAATAAAPTTAPAVQPLAVVNGMDILPQELYQPLVEAYGRVMLQDVMLLKLAKQQAAHAGITITPADIQAERVRMLQQGFPDASPSDYDQLLEQFLRQKNLSRVQYDLIVETNANLRAVVLPKMPAFSEEQIHQAFGQLYGENRQISDIEVPNMTVYGEVQRRLAAGEPFAQVASELSDDPRGRSDGGLLPPFSDQDQNIPAAIKNAAFSLKVGQVSPDPISTGNNLHVIRLDAIIPPRVVKFEDVRASVLQTIQDQWTKLAIDQLRNYLGQLAIATTHINDPTLAHQWQQMLDRQRMANQDRDQVRKELDRQRDLDKQRDALAAAAHPPATQPGAGPVSAAPGGSPSLQNK